MSLGKPVPLDKFLDEAIEIDVDCISDGTLSVIGGMLQHIEYAGGTAGCNYGHATALARRVYDQHPSRGNPCSCP